MVTSPRIKQKLRTKYNNDSNYKGVILEANIENRQKALNWEYSKVAKFEKQTGWTPKNQGRPIIKY